MIRVPILSYYKARYRKAKTGKTKARVMNGAMNLSHEDQQKFISWQTKFMNDLNEESVNPGTERNS